MSGRTVGEELDQGLGQGQPPYVTIGGAWWDVAVAEVSTSEPVREARAGYERNRQTQRPYL